MAPPPALVTQLRQLVQYHIDSDLLSNALFFAERLLAYDPKSSESSYLLALCHLRLGDNASAYEYSKLVAGKASHLGCSYVFAQACLKLQKHKEGIVALEKCRSLWAGVNNFGKHTSTTRQPYADGAAVACLAGKLNESYGNKAAAIGFYEEALKSNPFMWDAFTNLCDMGTVVRVPNIFKMSPEMEALLQTSSVELPEHSVQHSNSYDTITSIPESDRSRSRPVSIISDAPDPFNNVPTKGFTGGLFGTMGHSQKLNESNPSLTNLPAAGGGGIGPEAMETPTGPSALIDATLVPSRREHAVVSAYAEPPPVRKSRTQQGGLGMDFSVDAPKMSRGLPSKRTHRIHEAAEESAATQAVRSTNLAPPVDRKRTISGHVRQTSEDPGAPQRRSIRLLGQTRQPPPKTLSSLPTVGAAPGREMRKPKVPQAKIPRAPSNISTVGRQVSGNRKPMDDSMDVDQREFPRLHHHTSTNGRFSRRLAEADSSHKNEEAVQAILDLCKKIGSGYFALSQYRSHDALGHFNSLSKAHLETPWIMAQMGRAHYEQASYADAEKYFKRIRQIAPTRFQDMEIYSTILWHLKRETDLAFLSHELVDANWLTPQAWCALGNSWSLARDHEQALRCFKRATQLDPKFAYGFTLQGHEHVANEEYEKALTAYRHGISADKRHYNAWYGVGRVYEKQGDYEKAFIHFESAALINPTNAVLTTCIGTVLEKQKQTAKALKYYTRATELAPRSGLTRYKKARALMTMGLMEEAMEELMILKDLAPDAAMVHFQLGKLYKALKNKGAAVKHFTIALNLDPKVSALSQTYLCFTNISLGKSTNQGRYRRPRGVG